MMATLLQSISAATPLVKRLRLAVCCLAIGCILCVSGGCSSSETGKAILPDPDKVPPPGTGPMQADLGEFDQVPIVKD
jgi:hypothetical protein